MSKRAGGPGVTIRVRKGDVLDESALTVWLHANAPELPGDSLRPIEIKPLSYGVPDCTYVVGLGERSFILRRPPRDVEFGVQVGVHAGADRAAEHGVQHDAQHEAPYAVAPHFDIGARHDMSREYQLLTALHLAGVPVPRAIAFCDDETVLSSPFYLMEHVHGVIFTQSRAPHIRFDKSAAAALGANFVRQLVSLHALKLTQTGLVQPEQSDDLIAREISYWTRRAHNVGLADAAEINELATWLAANHPAPTGLALLHNHFTYDNLVLDPHDLTRIRAVLNWERASIGCPLIDLGTALAHWVEAGDAHNQPESAFAITAATGSPTRVELVRMYENMSGRKVQAPVFYYAYGLFKRAVVAQQIHFRSARSPQNNAAALALARLALAAVESGRFGYD